MRSVRLERTFDAVFVHDAVMYMTTPGDLRAVMRTAFEHLRPAGVALFVPDETTETFEARTIHGGHDAPGRGLRYLEWTRPPRRGESTYPVSFVILLLEDGESVRVVYDEHTFAMFPRATWLELLDGCGFEAGAMWHTYGSGDGSNRRELFWGLRPREAT